MPRRRAAAVPRHYIIHFSLLQHDGSCLLEQRLFTAFLFAHFLYQVVATQASHLLASRRCTTQVETTNHILDDKLIRQAIEGLVCPLPTLHIDAGVLQLVVEIGLGHGTEVVTLTGKLDVRNQLCQTPIHLVRLKR